ncbi:MAG TPA: SGNH/GDSL hydrolase family protein [Longimicrobium sp.]|nr:SGNH/GDSL hydrolase family protein [Longimicrobium sp.]
MKKFNLRSLAVLAGLPLALAACAEDDASIVGPGAGGPLFNRYVAIGNSITAGFQSGGINDSTMMRSYAYLLAERMGTEFNVPFLSGAACPAPLSAPFTTAPTPPAGATCYRDSPLPRVLNNVAVPGENIADLLTVPASSRGSVYLLHSLFLGSQRTQLQAAALVEPTFFTMWIGNNDALNAAVRADTTLLTTAAAFTSRVASVGAQMDALRPQGGVVIGVVNPNVIPLIQPGAFFYLAYQGAVAAGQPSPFGRPVLADCAPGTPGGSTLVSLAITQATTAQVPAISCDASLNPFTLTTQERDAIANRVTAYNTALQAEATARGWLYYDPNTLLTPFLADPNAIRKCQALATATTAAQLQAAVQTTCPSPSPSVGFGTLISHDGVHPSTAAHALIANALAAAINARYGTTLPTS